MVKIENWELIRLFGSRALLRVSFCIFVNVLRLFE